MDLVLLEKIEDTKGLIRRTNKEMIKRKKDNDPQKTIYSTTQTSLQTGSDLRCSGRINSSFSTSSTRPVTPDKS
jgi:hypothetical protein